MPKMSDYDRGVAVGVGLACAIIASEHDRPSVVSSALRACNLNRAKLKRAGLSDWDLEKLAPVFRELD